MAENNGLPRWVMKVASLVLIVLGFLMLATGYRYGYTGTAIGGVVLIVIGIVLLAAKIAARNRDRTI